MEYRSRIIARAVTAYHNHEELPKNETKFAKVAPGMARSATDMHPWSSRAVTGVLVRGCKRASAAGRCPTRAEAYKYLPPAMVLAFRDPRTEIATNTEVQRAAVCPNTPSTAELAMTWLVLMTDTGNSTK
mmetsp:Transcript_20010/g.27704  ORF Transcript_20010/g.27704 Transcript_20010/m.27704 type:complete len:130 (+) Transcript_20010:232-621(+)